MPKVFEMNFRVDWTPNLQALALNMNLVGGNAVGTIQRRMREVSESVAAVAKQRVPQDDYDLQRSIQALPSVVVRNEVVSTVMASTDYAYTVHEAWPGNLQSDAMPPSWREPAKFALHWTTPGTGPKYLESPFLEHLPMYEVHIREGFQTALKNAWRGVV